ncbi:hypothetical protein EON83_22770 [bacterium]|nr:MAG: hypothetical protein EON83_22770 [bacterium]
MKRYFSFTLAATLLGGVAYAQTPAADNVAPAVTTLSTAEHQKNFDDALRALRVMRLWNKPLDWNETGSSTKDVVTHVRKAMGEDAPLIEVRSKDANRSTFVLKQAPLGPTLLALADLADTSLWVFPGRLVLGPENMLSPEEKAAIQDSKGGEWQKSTFAQNNGAIVISGGLNRGGPWDPTRLMIDSAVSIAGSEIKTLLAAKGVPAPAPVSEQPTSNPAMRPNMTPEERTKAREEMFKEMAAREARPWPYELTFGELSPATQENLKELLKIRYYRPEQLANALKTITPSTIVGFNDMKDRQTELRLQNIKEGTTTERTDVNRWSVEKPRPAMSQFQ